MQCMNTGLETIDGMSLTNIVKSTGPNTDPCGTPPVTGMKQELQPLSTTFCRLFDKKSFIHINIFPWTPKEESFCNKRWWGTESKAF